MAKACGASIGEVTNITYHRQCWHVYFLVHIANSSSSMVPSADVVKSIKKGVCPCCGMQCVGVRPQHSLYNHMRRANDSKHAPWKLQYFSSVFAKAKRCTHSVHDEAATLQAVVRQLQHMYSREFLVTLSKELFASSPESKGGV